VAPVMTRSLNPAAPAAPGKARAAEAPMMTTRREICIAAQTSRDLPKAHLARAKSRLRSARMLVVLGAANAAVVVALWVHGGGLHDEALTSAGRLTGLLGAYLALISLVVVARGPRSSLWHRWAGHGVLWLLVAHTVLVTTGYTVANHAGFLSQFTRMIQELPGVITATAALLIFVAVAIANALRRRIRYETWYFIHLYTYLAVVPGFSHQLATGTEFAGDKLART